MWLTTKKFQPAVTSGWIKTIAGQARTVFRGLGRVGFAFTFAAAAYNLVCLIGRWRITQADLWDRTASDDGTLELEFAYHMGDEALLKAKRETSSAAC